MNTDLLYQIASVGLTYFQEARTIKALNGLKTALENQTNSPNADTIKAVGEAVNTVRTLLEKARNADYFPRTWLPAIEEIGFDNLLPSTLLDTVQQAVSGNQLVITEAVRQLTETIAAVSKFSDAFTAIKAQFDRLNLASVSPPPGQGELAIVLPRDIFDNELGDFWKEVKVIDRILGVIRESVDPGSPPIEIKQISTTDPMFLLAASIPVVMAVLKAVDQVLGIYERTLNIRKMKAEMVKVGNLDKAVEALTESVSATIEEGLAKVKKEFQAQHLSAAREGRREMDLANIFDSAVDDLAAQIDHGVRIEGDATPPTQPDGDATTAALEEQVVEIKRISRKIRYVEMQGEPVFKLQRRLADSDQ